MYTCQLSNIPDCCGALVLHSLFQNVPVTLPHYQMHYNHKATQKDVDAFNRREGAETKEQHRKRIDEYIKSNISQWKGMRSYLLVALNREQIPNLETVVLENGFEVLVPNMPNPNGTDITLYIYYLMPKPGTEKVEKKSILKCFKGK